MEKHLISVVLPVYNIEQYLSKCMESLFAQTYQNLEFVMVDDGSKERCAKMCDEYAKLDSRVVVYHKKNGGLSDARNYGIERAKGEFITCIDPDDFIDKDYIEYLYKMVQKYHTKMSICQHRVLYDNGSVVDYGENGDEKLLSKNCIERMLYHDVIDTSAWAKLYHKSLFSDVKYPVGKLFEDIATTYKLMLKCNNIAVGYESKYNYLFHDNSIVNSEFKLSKLDLMEMTDEMGRTVLGIYPDLKDAVMRRRVYARFSTLNQMLMVEGYQDIKNGIIKFIQMNGKGVLLNRKAPRRDKLAICLLAINYKLYKKIWLEYRNKLMLKKKQKI